MLGVVTGKPLNVGGSLGRLEATAHGALHPARGGEEEGQVVRGHAGRRPGFGNVGSYLARFVQEDGATVIGVGLLGRGSQPERHRREARARHKQETGQLEGLKDTETITNEELLELDVDVLAPCALEQVITSANADRIKAMLIVEGANGPTTPTADEILEDKGSWSSPTCWRMQAESSSRTSSGFRASRSTSGRKRRSTGA